MRLGTRSRVESSVLLEIVAEKEGTRGIVVQQIVVSKLFNLGAQQRIVWRVVPHIDDPGEQRYRSRVGKLVPILQRTGDPLLGPGKNDHE